jgi:hypothetical protein
MPAGALSTLSYANGDAVQHHSDLVTKDGVLVETSVRCEEPSTYKITLTSVWTERTHPGAPRSRFWFPLLAVTHDQWCVGAVTQGIVMSRVELHLVSRLFASNREHKDTNLEGNIGHHAVGQVCHVTLNLYTCGVGTYT